MELSENPIFGRKVFFLNLSPDLEMHIINPLREMEYEVFSISDYRDAKTILRNYPEAIFFVQVDLNTENNLNTNQWFNFLYSFQFDPLLKNVFLGVICRRLPTSKQNFFIINLQLPAGLLAATNGHEELFYNLIKVLEINGAKGRRQYVRARCHSKLKAILKCQIFETPITMNINDISSVGISCFINNTEASRFRKNLVIDNVYISLGTNDFLHCSIIVFAIKPINDLHSVVVFLLSPKTPNSVRHTIRNYVFSVLEKEIEVVEVSRPMDLTVYPEQISLDNDIYLIGEEDDADEVEELD